ncbi:Lon protease family protein [Amorphus sp. 3PC139-8]|uniref:Lon protease family protein n=1 Tax=Amorphus sp. 3PC139-8 TaxID=2735676 RepID=UPI00345DE587
MTSSAPAPISADRLLRRCTLDGLSFQSTDDLPDVDLMVAQDRAREAIAFGAEVAATGFNLFVVGASRDSMDEAVKAELQTLARPGPAPDDWVYLYNFETPHRPRAMALPPGRGPAFRDAMRAFVADLKAAIPAAFESDDYQARRTAIEQTFRERQEDAFKELQDEATKADIAVIRTPFGFTLAPMKEGKVVRPEAFNALPEVVRTRIQADIERLEKKLETVLRAVPDWDKQRRTEVRTLNQETTKNAVGHLIDELEQQFSDLPKILDHLGQVRADLVDNVGLFVPSQHSEQEQDGDAIVVAPFDRYEVNLLVTQPDRTGPPVVEELHPTLANLVGRVEHMARQGTLVTDFRLIKAGALHRANGGYLVLDARAVLTEPFAWAALKRILKAGEIRIESAVDLLSLTSTVTLEPDPIPLDVKIVLFGERTLYYLLSALDPDFREHFKVLADFDDVLTWTDETQSTFADLVATLAKRNRLAAFDRAAVARVIERAARIAGDQKKLSLVIEEIADLLVEADYLAKKAGRTIVGEDDIRGAVAAQIKRASRIRERTQESILRDIALIDTSGAVVGQANGLSVLDLGGFMFGRPSRITARVSPGPGRVVDIERQVELGGPLHSKGVLILSGFISGRYALDAPISLLASLVFEQSYGGIDGDSASSAELYTLLSALADVPLRQDLAITGSVNQHGMVQAIGGVNEKIEGFFDVCTERGLTGNQGVLIPVANAQHLMLREDVVDTCAEGRFAVYPITTIDEGIALLTGLSAGERGSDGLFPEGSVNRRVEDRLRRFAEARRSIGDEDHARRD